jgi:hypothetical protein
MIMKFFEGRSFLWRSGLKSGDEVSVASPAFFLIVREDLTLLIF